MSFKNASYGSVGPLPYDDDFFSALDTDGQITVRSAPVTDANVVRKGDLPTVAVTSVKNNDGTLTISPNVGAVVVSLALGNFNTWTVKQAFLTIGVKGISAPTAAIHIGAGEAAASGAPLKFVAGTNLITPENGAFEYDGTNLFFTRTGAIRESVFVGLDTGSAPTTAAIGILLDYYGTSSTRCLTTPNAWASVVIAGTPYKIPLYT